MITNLWNTSTSFFYETFADSFVFILLLLCLVYLGFQEKDKFRKFFFLGSTALFSFLYFCPLTSYVFMKMIGEGVYHRAFWCVPIVLLIAYGFTHLLNRLTKVKAFLSFLGFSILISVSGYNVFYHETLHSVENPYRIRDDVVEVLQYIPNNSHVYARNSLAPYIRLYNPSLTLPHARYTYGANDIDTSLASVMDIEDPYSIVHSLDDLDCDYLILFRIYMDQLDERLGDTCFEDYGYEIIGATEEWYIYENTQN